MKYIFLDTETTGVGDNDKIIQLAFLVYDENGGSELFNVFCSTDQEIDFKAMTVHHITPEMLAGKLPLQKTEEYHKLLELNISENYLIIQNAKFDLRMLEKEGFSNQMKVIDTLKIARNLMPDLDGHSAQFMRYRLGIYKKEKQMMQDFGLESVMAHDALGDIIVLKSLFDYLKNLKELDARYKVIELLNVALDIERLSFADFSKYSTDDQL